MNMKPHIQVVAWIYIILGILGILIGLLAGGIVAGGGWISGDQTAIRITSLVAIFVVGMIVIFSIPGIIAGAGLLRYQSWARILAIILALLNLPGFPIGTLLGIYAIWVLFDNESVGLFN